MTTPVFVSVVEGHGDSASLRPLIHNILASIGSDVYPKILNPYRAHWGSIVNSLGDLERYAEIVLQEGGATSRLLVLIDADDYCPAELGPELASRLGVRFPHIPISVNVANWEFETWFIASFEAIATRSGIDSPVQLPEDIEAIADAKGWLEQNVINRRYKETEDQPAFSSFIDVSVARQRSPSFDRFCREVERLLTG